MLELFKGIYVLKQLKKIRTNKILYIVSQFPNSLSPWKIPEDSHEIMEVGVSWELDDVFQSSVRIHTVPAGTDVTFGLYCFSPYQVVWVHSHPVVVAGSKHLVWLGPRVRV